MAMHYFNAWRSLTHLALIGGIEILNLRAKIRRKYFARSANDNRGATSIYQ